MPPKLVGCHVFSSSKDRSILAEIQKKTNLGCFVKTTPAVGGFFFDGIKKGFEDVKICHQKRPLIWPVCTSHQRDQVFRKKPACVRQIWQSRNPFRPPFRKLRFDPISLLFWGGVKKKTQSPMEIFGHLKIPSREKKHIPQKWHFEDDFPIPKVGYVSSLEGRGLQLQQLQSSIHQPFEGSFTSVWQVVLEPQLWSFCSSPEFL